MVTSLGFLKQAGKIEKELEEIACNRTLQKLSPYSSHPEVAKVIDYITTYRCEIPESHMIFNFIKSIEESQKKKDEVKSVVRDRLGKKGLLSPKQKEEIRKEEEVKRKKPKEVSKEEEAEIRRDLEKCLKTAEQMEGMLNELEKHCDASYDFFNKNANSIARISKQHKVNGVRNLLMALKGNLRALKVR